MTKKQKKSKKVLQNKRNKLLNGYYKSRIKSLSKTLTELFKNSQVENKNKICKIWGAYYFSFLDKAVKKNVIHRNTAAKRKSKFDTAMCNCYS